MLREVVLRGSGIRSACTPRSKNSLGTAERNRQPGIR
jgi:hypothetical protein